MTGAAALLVGLMIALMVARVTGPFGQRATGRTLYELRLTIRERLLLHRHGFYSLGIVLVLGTATGAIPPVIELAGMAGAFAVAVGIQATYRVTNDGIAFNHLVFRRWDEFGGIDETRTGLRLIPLPGTGKFTVICLRRTQRHELRDIITRCLSHAPRVAAPMKAQQGTGGPSTSGRPGGRSGGIRRMGTSRSIV